MQSSYIKESKNMQMEVEMRSRVLKLPVNDACQRM